MQHKPKFVHRTITNGMVQVQNKFFAPRLPLPEKLNNKRMVFGVYYNEHNEVTGLCLWGSQKKYYSENEEDFNQHYCKDLELITENGVFLWEFWDRKLPNKARSRR